jgi:hypothetical protein
MGLRNQSHRRAHAMALGCSVVAHALRATAAANALDHEANIHGTRNRQRLRGALRTFFFPCLALLAG